MRAMLSSSKGARPGIEARGPYDALMERVLPREDVTFEEDTPGGVGGLWVLPADWRSSDAIVHQTRVGFTIDGRRFRVITVIDQWSRESVLVEPGSSRADQLGPHGRSHPISRREIFS